MGDLVVKDADRLAELEDVIDRGARAFVEVGEALAEIRESRLYRFEYERFEDYCRDRWGFNDSRARQLIGAAGTVTTVTAVGLPAPANEAQARELAPLKDRPEDLQAAWQEATSNGRVTAAKVTDAVAKRLPEREAPKYHYCPTCGARIRAGTPRPPREEK